MPPYIYQVKGWPQLRWDAQALQALLAKVRLAQGRLLGRMETLGFEQQDQAGLEALAEETLRSFEIEGEKLDARQVRSSLARKLGLETGGLGPSSRHVDGVVEMMLDATRGHAKALTAGRLFGWHAALFSSGHSGLTRIRPGAWRDDRNGPMQVVSGPLGRETVHFEAPPAAILPGQMALFLKWFNAKGGDDVLKAGAAHLWFVTLHPFDDGNGRVARAIADMALARSDSSPRRFYSMSPQIMKERAHYYDELEAAQSKGLDITAWQEWFLGCLGRALKGADLVLDGVLKKAKIFKAASGEGINVRQAKLLGMMADGFEGSLTSSKWAKISKCSQDTASRDIEGLVQKGLLKKNPGGGRSTSFSLAG